MTHPASASGQQRFLMLALAAFASMSSMRICDAMLPALAAEFNTSTGAAAHTVSVFVIAYGICQLIYGPFGDRYGKAQVIRLAVMVSAGLNLALWFAPSLQAMVWLRVLAGAAAGGIVPLCLAFIGDAVPYGQRQAVLAQFLTALILGMIVGQWAGGLFADYIGWRWAFLALAVGFAVVALAMTRRLPTATGATTSDASFFTQVKGVMAIAWARRISLFGFIEGALVFSSLVFIPTYLHSRFGVALTWAGALVTLFGVGGLVYARTARHLLARLGERGLAGYGGLLMGAGVLVLALGPHWAWALPGCFIFGLGFYMMHNTLQTHATQMAPQARGTGVALFVTMLFLGQALGVSAMSPLVDEWGARAGFVVSLLGLPVLGAVFAWSLVRRERRGEGG